MSPGVNVMKLFFFVDDVGPMFVEISDTYSPFFTFLVRWHACAVSLPSGAIIFAQLACPLKDENYYVYIKSN